MTSRSPLFSRSLLREALLPPWFEEPRTNAGLAWFAKVRIVMIVSALLIDVNLYLLLKDVPGIETDALEAFAAINIGVLGVDGLLTWLMLRLPERPAQIIESIVVPMEMFTIAVWIQLTGTISSYFLGAGFLIPFGYRIFAGYRVGLIAYASVVAFHIAAFVLEDLGVLRPVSLFTDASSAVYEVQRYRYIVMATILSSYATGFAITNLFVVRRRRRDSELREAREQLANMANGLRYGRLSGTSIAGGDYELAEVLGRGGMGEVYRARRHADGLECAIKLIHPHLAHRPNILARFKQEAEAASKLPEHVAPGLIEARLEGADRFIAMEFLPGEDLAAHLRRRRRLPPDEALAMVRRIATLLDAAHQAGLVHRDLKPHNIQLIDANDSSEVRLLDFGIAKLREGHSDLTRSGVVMGSPGYMAPEQARGDAGRTGPAADTFALGAIAFELLTGERAFPARDSRFAVGQMIYLAPVRPSRIRSELHPDVDAAFTIALAKAPEERFQTATALAEALADALRGDLDDALRERGERSGSQPESDSTLTATGES